jgi:ABC-type transporter Mla subunit MlaD
MTNYDPDRLNRIEALVESNARAIQALGDHISELTNDVDALTEANRQAAEERAELRRATIGIANLLGSLDEDRPTILRKLNSIESKVDRLLERGNGNGDQP